MRAFIFLSAFFTFIANATVGQTDHVGLWRGLDRGEVGYVELSRSGHATFIFGTDTIGGATGKINGEKAQLQYKVDYDQVPAQIDFVAIRATDLLEVGVLKGIFKMNDHDQMVLCINFEGDVRPLIFTGEDCIEFHRITSIK